MIQKLDENRVARDIRRKINQIIDELAALRIANAPGLKVKRTSAGTILQVAPPQPVSGGTGPEVQRFKVMDFALNWLLCRKVDSTGAETTGDIKVMTPIQLRRDSNLLDGGVPGSLVFSGFQQRTYNVRIESPTVVNFSVTERIRAPYLIGDFIYAINNISGGTVDDGSGAQVEWLDLNVDGRHWEMDLRQIDVCVSGNTTRQAMAPISQPGV